ncbi:hypothetical protein [Paracoccus yeei]|uniref:DUF2282 domain-containing protein n=1 Tax=Paracoccus yeei TaxID=147645 RepID=A0A2D2C1Z6_9RHOB|nr:hypothetical protein [Paracoccus yeei]ATQ56540.1 hypothetical protein PYTT13_12560 [Paracoccus yeei]
MKFLVTISATAFAAAPAFAAATAPAGSSAEDQALVQDWAKYSTACRGGAVDGTQETAWGYCGVANYVLFKLEERGICKGEGKGDFINCDKSSRNDPLKDYPF